MEIATEALRRTPLYEAHLQAGAKMVPFGGWEMPVHYGSQIEEHMATRQSAGIFDVSHMGEIQIQGPHALDLVQELVTQDISKLGDGDEAYTVLCREDGGIIDDLIVTRFGPENYFLVVNAGPYEKCVAFMQGIAERMALKDTTLTPCAEQWAMIALQGPRWAEFLKHVIGDGDWEQQKRFRSLRLQYEGGDLIFSTTGYTGELGCELLCPPDKAQSLWTALMSAGAQPVGLAARDSLRLEKGFCLSGQDFTEANNPYEAGLGWVVKLGKESFSGKDALAAIKESGPKQRLVGLWSEGRRIPRHDCEIWAGDQKIGRVTSGGYAPCLERPVSLGYIDAEFSKKGTEVEIDLGRSKIKAEVTRPPFHP